MTRSEEYGFYAIAERRYKECAQKNTVVHAIEKITPGLNGTPGFLVAKF
jgi:hypothetical protein